MPIVMATDAGRSGKTAFNILVGTGWNVRCVHMEDHSSISAPDIERYINSLNAQFSPEIIMIEGNGPGGVIAEFSYKNNPNLPMFIIYPDHPPIRLALWENIVLSEMEYVNIRAEMYFILRYLFRDNRIILPYEDPELFAQLTSTYWQADKNKSDRIQLTPKKMLRFSSHSSELEGYDFSRSPDKADALTLAALGYALLMQEEAAANSGESQEEEIIQPDLEHLGFFPIGATDIEIEYE